MLLSWTKFTLQCTRNVIPVLSSDVIKICGKFVTQLKQKINSSKLNNHLEKKAIKFFNQGTAVNYCVSIFLIILFMPVNVQHYSKLHSFLL